MSTTPVCNKCFRPQHTFSEIGGQRFTACVEAEKDEIVFTDQWKCGCCKCPTMHIPKGTTAQQLSDILANPFSPKNLVIEETIDVPVGSTFESKMSVAVEEFHTKRNFYMFGEEVDDIANITAASNPTLMFSRDDSELM